MATHASILAWRIPWTEEPGGLQSTGSPRVGRDRAADTHFHTGGAYRHTHSLSLTHSSSSFTLSFVGEGV